MFFIPMMWTLVAPQIAKNTAAMLKSLEELEKRLQEIEKRLRDRE